MVYSFTTIRLVDMRSIIVKIMSSTKEIHAEKYGNGSGGHEYDNRRKEKCNVRQDFKRW